MVFKLKKRFSELGFWHYQLLGFGLFIINDLTRGASFFFSSPGTVVYMIYSYLTIFGLTLLLRYIYRPLYKQKKSQIYYFFILSVVSFLFSALCVELRLVLRYPLVGTDGNWFHFKRDYAYLSMILTTSWIFFVWSILYFSIKYWQDLNREYERSKASQLLASRAQLQMLRYQINPHFLFNTLTSIKALTYENPEQAGTMLTELSEFLRATLNYNEKVFVTVKEEMEIIEKYLSIEKVRFEERLNYKVHASEDILGCEIVCFITQPLVENAIKHGLNNNPRGITLTVNVYGIGDLLKIDIINSGTLWNRGDTNGTGIRNVRERLENAYNGRYKFNIEETGGNVVVSLVIPRKP